MLVPAIFGISNSGVNLAIDLIILFLVVIWLALVYWTYADARRRIADPPPGVGVGPVDQRQPDHDQEQDHEVDDETDRVVLDPEDSGEREH